MTLQPEPRGIPATLQPTREVRALHGPKPANLNPMQASTSYCCIVAYHSFHFTEQV